VGAVPLAQGIADLADRLAKGIPEDRPMTVAVTDFPDLGGQTCRLGRYVAERLSTLLSQHAQCRLIERRRLDMVLQELKFSMSELVDPAKARKLGQMLGVQGLVVGTVSDVGTTLDLDARIIDIQTDLSLPGASASIVKDEGVREMGTACGQIEKTGVVGTGGGSREGGAPVQPLQKAEAQDYSFVLESCRTSGGSVTCTFLVTNLLEEDRDLVIAADMGDPSGARFTTRAFDDMGGEYRAESVRIGNKGPSNGGLYHFVSGVATPVALSFDAVSSKASKFALLELTCVLGGERFYGHWVGKKFPVQFRGTPLAR